MCEFNEKQQNRRQNHFKKINLNCLKNKNRSRRSLPRHFSQRGPQARSGSHPAVPVPLLYSQLINLMIASFTWQHEFDLFKLTNYFKQVTTSFPVTNSGPSLFRFVQNGDEAITSIIHSMLNLFPIILCRFLKFMLNFENKFWRSSMSISSELNLQTKRTILSHCTTKIVRNFWNVKSEITGTSVFRCYFFVPSTFACTRFRWKNLSTIKVF